MGRKKGHLFCYAVAAGRKPGFYRSWDECRRQVVGFKGNAYRGCETHEQAEKFMEDRGAGAFAAFLDSQSANPGEPDMASRVKSGSSDSRSALAPKTSSSQTQQPRIASRKVTKLQDTRPYRGPIPQQQQPPSTQTAFKDERAEIAASQQLPPGSQARKEGRTGAMHEILEGKSELEGFQDMCRAVGVEPGSTKGECKDAILSVLVNIVDFIDNVRAGRPVKVWELEEREEFRKYTDDDDKSFNLEIAKESDILSCFLHRLLDSGPKRPRKMPNRLSENVSDDMSDGISDGIHDTGPSDDAPSSLTDPESCASNSKKRRIAEEREQEAQEIKRPRIVN
ncbi:hypothetical protein DL769_002795 [Monosporascus sp. CRB-8-3]|nr:hypothetical protein DL769_002795 [Monosporascus sp. CRB-8-3]